MKPKFRDVLDMVELDELMKIKNDIESHKAAHLKALVEQKIRQQTREEDGEAVCSTCLGAVSPFAVENYTLLFGPEEFKKKVNFCSIGCMNSFLKNMEKSKGFSSNIKID